MVQNCLVEPWIEFAFGIRIWLTEIIGSSWFSINRFIQVYRILKWHNARRSSGKDGLTVRFIPTVALAVINGFHISGSLNNLRIQGRKRFYRRCIIDIRFPCIHQFVSIALSKINGSFCCVCSLFPSAWVGVSIAEDLGLPERKVRFSSVKQWPGSKKKYAGVCRKYCYFIEPATIGAIKSGRSIDGRLIEHSRD